MIKGFRMFIEREMVLDGWIKATSIAVMIPDRMLFYH